MAWVDDGQETIKPGSSPEEFVVEGKAKAGTPVNARFSTPVTKESNYFEVDCINVGDSAFIGITTEASFKKGWGCKGLLFGRNLSSGGALVRQGFGENITSGSTVGVLTEFLGDGAARKVQVTFWQNSKCLGPAFLSSMANPEAEVFPMVHTNKEGDKFAIRFGSAPDMGSSGGAAAGDPREGTWLLQALRVGPELGEVPLAKMLQDARRDEVMVKISKGTGPGEFVFNWQIVNPCHMTAVSSTDDSLSPFDKLECGQVASGRMGGPDAHMEAERLMGEAMMDLSKWILDSNCLLLNGPTAELELVPGGGGDDGSLPATEVQLV